MAPIRGLASKICIAASTSASTAEFNAFSAFGRLSVTRPTLPRVSTMIVS
jgi:hypothetical protein